MMDIELLFVQF